MIKLEKLESGTYFRDAFLVTYRHSKENLDKIRKLKYRRYIPEKQAWEIPASELKQLVNLFGEDEIDVNSKYLNSLIKKEDEKAAEPSNPVKERLKGITPIV